MKRILICLLIVVTILLSQFAPAYAYDPSFWAENGVSGAMNLSIIPEVYSTKPYQEPILRMDFVNVAVNLYATITAENVCTHPRNPFVDTQDTFSNMAYYLGLVAGDGEKNFHPKDHLTRQEMCMVIVNLLQSAGVDKIDSYFPSENVFDEVVDVADIAEWAKARVAFMLDNYLMSGDETGYFRPNDPVTREEAALIAYRCYIRYGQDYDGQIKTSLRQSKDAKGNTIQTLVKTITLNNGMTVALANANNPEAQVDTAVAGKTDGVAPSGTPLAAKGEDGLYRLKTYSETLATGEAKEKENRIFGDGEKYTSAAEADAHMSEVTVDVWKINGEGVYYPSTLTFRINTVLKEDVIAIFDEIYHAPVKAPLKDVNAYAWRSAMSSGNYSDHNYGTAIDLNYNENYCVYASGAVVGTFYDPANSVYSFPKDGIVVQTFAKYGWLWGGNAWVSGTVDHMHFSYLGK